MAHRRNFGRRRKPPAGWDFIEPTLRILDDEMRRAVEAPHEGLRKSEAIWPVHQINWQRTRYIFDLYYKYHRITRELFDYCVQEKIADEKLMAFWKKPGYERLCSTYVINPKNYNFGTVPRQELEAGKIVMDQTTGCRGCCSGAAGYKNIFGNKYGQHLADIQIQRERLREEAAMRAAAAEDDRADARARSGASGSGAGGGAAGSAHAVAGSAAAASRKRGEAAPSAAAVSGGAQEVVWDLDLDDQADEVPEGTEGDEDAAMEFSGKRRRT